MSDTSPIAASIQADIHRRLSPVERLRIAMDMSDVARAFARSRVRGTHPDWSEREVTHELIAILYPDLAVSQG